MLHYRLPDGKTTRSSEEYYDAWHTLAAPLEKLTNSKLMAFNPSLAFIRDDINSSYWEMPADIAILLVAELKKTS